MDEQVAITNVQKVQEVLDRTTSKSKKQKEEADEYCITFENLEQYPANGSSIGELMGGQALLWDYTTAAELKQLCELVNQQVQIACRFDAKFSNMAVTLLQKMQGVFIGISGIARSLLMTWPLQV